MGERLQRAGVRQGSWPKQGPRRSPPPAALLSWQRWLAGVGLITRLPVQPPGCQAESAPTFKPACSPSILPISISLHLSTRSKRPRVVHSLSPSPNRQPLDSKMAEENAATFKLVLCGDGGTVSLHLSTIPPTPTYPPRQPSSQLHMTHANARRVRILDGHPLHEY